MSRLFAFASVALLAVGAPARAQVFVTPAEPGVVYYYPAASEPTPLVVTQSPAAPAESRLRRGLQLLADPTRLLPGGSGRAPSEYPALDAAPTVVRLVSFGLFAASGSAGGALVGVPYALRLGRVILVGPPPAATTRRETLLWIASPGALYLRNRVQARRAESAACECAPACQPAPRRGLFGRRR